MNPTVDALAGVFVALLTGGLKLFPGLKDHPWHNAVIRLAAVALSVALVAGIAHSQGRLATLDWPTVLPVLGDALVAFLAATGVYHLTPPPAERIEP